MPNDVDVPEWLVTKVEARLALIEKAMMSAAHTTDAGFVMTYLDEPDEDVSDEGRKRWERTCDRCGAYCPDDVDFYTGHVLRMIEGRQVMLVFGMCDPCRVEG